MTDRLTIAQLVESPLFAGFNRYRMVGLIEEEVTRCRLAEVKTWQGYRSLNRVGSLTALGGRQKKAIWRHISYRIPGAVKGFPVRAARSVAA